MEISRAVVGRVERATKQHQPRGASPVRCAQWPTTQRTTVFRPIVQSAEQSWLQSRRAQHRRREHSAGTHDRCAALGHCG